MTAGTLSLGTSFSLNKEAILQRSYEAPSFILDWKEYLKSSAIAIKIESSKPGWDGYDACPISDSSLEDILALIEKLPSEVSSPDIVPETSGEIGLEWRNRERKICALSISNGNLIYAAILGERKVRGEEPFNRYELPPHIKELLSYFCK